MMDLPAISGWVVGPAIVDEAQKEPGVFDKVKLAYDERQIAFSVLLGSSRLLLLAAEPPRLLGDEATYRIEALDHLAVWGGMPELLSLEDDERQEWLRSYRQTWLERDLADLTRVSDLLPFRTLQRLAMLRTAQFLNYPLRTRMATRTSGTETTRRRT